MLVVVVAQAASLGGVEGEAGQSAIHAPNTEAKLLGLVLRGVVSFRPRLGDGIEGALDKDLFGESGRLVNQVVDIIKPTGRGSSP